MAAADPPDPKDGPGKLFPKSVLEEVSRGDEQSSFESPAGGSPMSFDPPSHRQNAGSRPMPEAPSARIVNAKSPTTDESDGFDSRSYERPQLPHRPEDQQRSKLLSSDDGARSTRFADQTGIMRSAGDGPTVRGNTTDSPRPTPGGPSKAPPSAPSPHLTAVPSIESIATKCCGDGHPNNPDVRVCRICGVTFRPTTKIVQMTPGAIFRLIFEDGTAIEIADDIVVGRSPIDDNVVDTLTVDDPQVSRQHFVLEALGWQLSIRDCGSMNGTYLSRRGKRGRVRVSPDMAIPVQAGDTVHFGSRQALIVDIGPS